MVKASLLKHRLSEKLTNKEARDLATYLGFKEVKNGFKLNKASQPVFTNGKVFIVQEVDSHIGGAWKMGESIEDLNKKETRYGMYDALLDWIGK